MFFLKSIGHVEISKCLINAAVDVNRYFAFMLLIIGVRSSISYGHSFFPSPRKNLEGMNALMLASQRGHADMVKLLIQVGAAMDEQTMQGSTALMLACKRGHEKCVEVSSFLKKVICLTTRTYLCMY